MRPPLDPPLGRAIPWDCRFRRRRRLAIDPTMSMPKLSKSKMFAHA